MPEIRKHLTTINRTVGRSQPIKYIVVHYTYGSVTKAGAALANCKYFASAYRGASAHYFIDDGPVIWQSVEDKDTAWSVGAKTYRHRTARNSNTLNIEVCTKSVFTEAEISNLTWLVKKKMAQYKIPPTNVIRHYDVTGKFCPAYYIDASRWSQLRGRITGGDKQVPAETNPTVIEVTPPKPVYHWIVISLFDTPDEAWSFSQWCKANGIAAKPSGIAVVTHGNDEKSRKAEAEAEERGGVCPWGRIFTTADSYKHFNPRTPYLPERTKAEERVNEMETALDQIYKYAQKIIETVNEEV